MELNNNTLIPDSFIIRTKPVRHVGGIFCGGVNEWDKFKSGSDVAGTWRPAWDPSLTRTTLLCVRMCSTKQSSWVYWWPAYAPLRTPSPPTKYCLWELFMTLITRSSESHYLSSCYSAKGEAQMQLSRTGVSELRPYIWRRYYMYLHILCKALFTQFVCIHRGRRGADANISHRSIWITASRLKAR